MSIDLDPVEWITADAVGEVGDRTFFIQGRSGTRVVALLVEKQQVAALCNLIEQLLERVSSEHGPETETDMEAPGLQEPLVPEFRVGQIGVGYDAERDLVLLQCEEIVSDAEEEEEEVESPQADVVRYWASREQMLAMARRGEAAVAAGRPTCSMCGNPIDPDGHFCPQSNGHKPTDELP